MIESNDLMFGVLKVGAAASMQDSSMKGVGALSDGDDLAAKLEARKCGGIQP